jgi:hypothetical protein
LFQCLDGPRGFTREMLWRVGGGVFNTRKKKLKGGGADDVTKKN